MATDHRLLKEYSRNIRNLKNQCVDDGMTEDEFRKLYFECLDSINTKESVHLPFYSKIKKKYIICLAIIALISFMYNIRIIYSAILCNLQELIYPGMKLLRRLSTPLISSFPSFTEYYHETCLIQNPFFTVADMDCGLCRVVFNVDQVHEPYSMEQYHGIPFTFKTDQPVITIETLKTLYLNNQKIFNEQAPRILTNNKYFSSPDQLFSDQKDKRLYIWKFNSLDVNRILRQIIPRPKIVPKFGQSTERYIIIDSRHESFHIPDTECSYAFILLLSGTSTIDLKPSDECKHQCKIQNVELKESHLLWYNWWYWRPVVQPSNSNITLLAQVGSYC